MSEVFDPKMPELGEHDPRLCPGEPVLSEWDETDGPRPEWWPPEPHTRVHDWQGGGSLSGKDYQRYCRWCEVKEDAVRARWSDWRYEQLVEKLTQAVTRLTNAIERKNG